MISKIRSWIRHLYDRVQHWGRSKTCIRDLAILTFISTTIAPIPTEPFLFAIVIAAPYRWFRAAAAATLSAVAGSVVWYIAGWLLFNKVAALVHYLYPSTNWDQVRWLIQNEGAVYLSVAVFTPGLFRVATLAAGAVIFNPILFILAVGAGRGFRFFIEAGLMRLFGEKIRPFIERYFDLVTLGLSASVVLLIIMIRIVHH